MKKKFNTKAKLIGIALLAAGATVSIPAVIPAQAQAAEASAQTVTETEKKTVTRTVRFYYKGDNGKVTPVKSSNGGDFVRTASATFERNVIKDKSTGKVVSAPAWGTAVLDGFDVPVINGYTPDKETIPSVTVSPDKQPQDIAVYYTENPEHKKTLSTESKTISRKITYYRINDDGSTSQTFSKTQSATFTRSVTTDGNGKKEYGAWAQHTFAAEDVSPMAGYTPDIKTIPAVTFTPDNPPADVKVYFRKNASGSDNRKAAVTVTFTDGLGKVLESGLVEVGKNAVAPAAPTREGYTFAGWDKVLNNVQDTMTIAAKWVKNATATLTENKHVERKIYYYYADGSKVIDVNGKHAVATQSADFTRYNIKDTVTGKITYGKWQAVTWDKMKVMEVKGYTPNIKEIAAVTFTPDNAPKDIKVYYSKNTGVKDTFTGVRYQNNAWTYVKNGKADYTFTGVAQSTTGNWVFVRKGKFDESYTGVACSTTGNWIFVKNGRFNTSFTGVAQSTTGNWVFVKNGRFSTSFTGVAQSTTGNWVFVKNGRFAPSFTGVAPSINGNWIFVRNGRFTTSYTGVATSITGNKVYVKNGRFTTAYTGYAKDINGKNVYVKNGRV